MAKLKVAFLDVGHGDFIYALTPLGDNLVIDLGSGDVIPSNYLSPVKRISELQISHPHTDHFDDILSFSKTVASFRCPRLDLFKDTVIGWKKSDKAKITKLRQLKDQLSANNDAVTCNTEFQHTVWHPTNIDANDPNTASIVTTLSYKGVKFLFGGDLPESGWLDLLTNDAFKRAISGTTIFKVPHHGRKEGCCQALFDLPGFKPKLCIISDKPLQKDNKNTVATDWYCKRTSGYTVKVGNERKTFLTGGDKRQVLSTRSDKSIYAEVDDNGTLSVHTNTQWL